MEQHYSTMLLLVLFSVTVGAVSGSRYSGLAAALESPGQLLSLYEQFSVNEGKAKSPQRLSLFRSSLKRIADGNARHPTWTQGLNKFADLTVEEKSSYLGLNASTPKCAPLDPVTDQDFLKIPESKDWRAEGKVTGVKNQASCGSCWTFGAVGPIETNYAILTGKRKSFAEKEYLDCVYSYDGCNGGWYEDCWNYSAKKGRLALTSDVKYVPQDGRCGRKYKKKHDGLIGAKITGCNAVPVGEKNVIALLAEGAVGIAFEVTDDFFDYQKGIIEDMTCQYGDNGGGTWGAANHAVTGVGYTKQSMIVKNSWGSNWGAGGYFETARGTGLCEYWRWAALPTWKKTDVKDNDPDYVPTEDEDCEGTNADGCACGTVRCNDGKCRHAHMC